MIKELEQYLQFFIDHRQKDQPEWSVMAKFIVNNKTYLATKMSLFIANYGRKLRIKTDIRKKVKIKRVIEFTEKMKKIQEKTEVKLRKVQEEIK